MSSSGTHAKYTSPFAPLQLSESDVETLEKLSRLILLNYMAQYEGLARARARGEGIDERVWKLIKQRENFRIFKQRKLQADSASGDNDSAVRRALAGFSNSGAVPSTQAPPVILAMGNTPGALDDVMYAVVNPTIEVLRVKSSYIDDHFADVAVLATLASPTQEDPYQSLLIKWGNLGPPVMLRPAVNNRDFVYMERTGIAYTSAGERVGYHLIHSVHFSQTHELPGTLRGHMTLGGVYRDNHELKQVDMYTHSTIDPRGVALHALVVLAAADMLTVADKYVECAQRKKLMWRVRRAQRLRSIDGCGSEDVSLASSSTTSCAPDKLGPCTICLRVPLKLANALRDPHKRTCALCARYVCSSCRVKKTLSEVASPTATLRHRSYSFCGACYNDVCQANTFVVAQQELAGGGVEEHEAAIKTSSAESDLLSLTSSQ